MFANFLASHFPDATKQLSPLAGSRRPYRAGSRIDSYSGRFWPYEIAVRVRKTNLTKARRESFHSETSKVNNSDV
jgi:hypothetical protein